MKNIILQYDSWYLILCILAGLIYGFVLYYKQKHLKDKSLILIISLFILRFLSVTAISFLLLSPLFKYISEQKSKPIVVLIQDYSSSLKNIYSKEELVTLNNEIHNIKQNLNKKYEVQEYSIGEDILPGLKDSFNFKSTNLSKGLDYINNSFDNQELAAVILSSDGIFNEGTNPDYVNLSFNAPIHTIALGDTTIKRDIFISNVYYNDIAFLGDKIVIKTDIQAKNAKGTISKLKLFSISENGQSKLISNKTIRVTNDDYFQSEFFNINTKQAGIDHYRLSLSKLDEELSYKNNTKDIFIEVIDSRIKILLYANNPHPDLGAIKQALLMNKNYELDIKYPNESIKPEDYDLIIYHNLPSNDNSISNIHNKAVNKEIPELYIVGTETNLNRFNKIQNLLKISGNSTSFNEVQAVLNKDFNLFLTDEFSEKGLENFPPLIAPFGEYVISPDSRVVLFQSIKKIVSKYPLLVVNIDSKNKVAVFTGSNIFKWRLYDYFQNQNINIIKSLLSQVTQYLTIKKDKSQWRVQSSKNIFNETDNIQFIGELYDDNYEPINEPEAVLKIINDKRKEFDFVFTRTQNHYKLNSGIFPSGNYTYIANVKAGNKNLSKKGKFSIVKLELEKFDLVAKHNVLHKLSSHTGGDLFYPNQIENLVNKLNANDAKPIIYSSQKTKKLIDYKWLFWIILLLLGTEWFTRRYNGTF